MTTGYDSGVWDDGVYDGELSLVPTLVAPTRVAPRTLEEVLAQASHVAIARLTVLEQDLVTVRRRFDLDQRIILEGSGVTAEYRRDVRRSGSLRLVNTDGSLSPVLYTDLLAPGSPIVIERGAIVDGVPVYAPPLLTGFVSVPQASMDGTVSISAESYLSACAQEAGEAITLPQGMYLVDALHTLLDPVLPAVHWVVWSGADERALGAAIPVLASDERLHVAITIAGDLGCDVYDDRYGRIMVRPRPDPASLPVSAVMTLPLALLRTMGRLPVNAQGVESSPGADEPFYVVAEITDQASPIHRSRIGLRMAPTLRSDSIPDPGTALATARALLAERALAQDILDVRNLPTDGLLLDEGMVVERTELITGTSGRFLLDGIDYPVGPGELVTREVTVAVIALEDVA